MATEVIEKTEQEQAFDAKAFIEARNAGKTPEAPKVEEKTEAKPEPKSEPEQPRLPRSVRRELNRLREELGAERARRELAEQGKTAAAKEAPKEEAEPQRKDFASDAEYLRATQKWDKAQEVKAAGKGAEESQQIEQLREHLKAMDEKAAEDMKLLSDWDEVAKKAAESEDAVDFVPDEHPVLMAMLAQSDVKAFLLYHFAKNPDDLEKMLELTPNQPAQIKAFHRLEGKLEKEYSTLHRPAQGSEPAKEPKDRKDPAEAARPGGTAAGGQPAKPKPSSEVAARGGSPAPDEPAIGSPAWMQKRNQAQFGY